MKITRSAQEDDFIYGLVMKQPTVTRRDAWIGLQRNAADKKFYWVDSTPLEGHYQNWNKGEPNNYEPSGEDCVHIWGSEPKFGKPGKWNDAECNVRFNYCFDEKDSQAVLCQKRL